MGRHFWLKSRLPIPPLRQESPPQRHSLLDLLQPRLQCCPADCGASRRPPQPA